MRTLVIGLLLWSFLAVPAFATGTPTGAQAQVSRLIEGWSAGLFVLKDAPPLHRAEEVAAFYRTRGFAPAWTNAQGPLPAAGRLLASLKASPSHGLAPRFYHLKALKDAFSLPGAFEPDSLAALDILLTDAFITYAGDLRDGHAPPEGTNEHREASDAPLLERALASGSVGKALESLAPRDFRYQGMRKALARYRAIAREGGWPRVPPGLEPGARGPGVSALKKRLALTDGFPLSADGGDLFDDALVRALKGFQRRHGLPPRGLLDEATLQALNVPMEDRILQIAVSLERLRWLLPRLGPRYVLVNIPDFTLTLVEDNRKVATMRVVTGKLYAQTPVLNARITELVLNPSWFVPRSIALEEILPKVRENPWYLKVFDMKVLQGPLKEARVVDPWKVDWESVTEKNFPYTLVQGPGPTNPLGRVKFILPNPYGVYMHDTPSGELFQERVRTFSHSCIRLEKPLVLARHVLGGSDGWGKVRLQEAIARGEQRTLRIKHPLDVYIVYLTAWVEEDGTLHFRDDIYSLDAPLARALGLR
jgi:murein L,D-transpeptidase YcbB/YkuD